LNKNTKLKEEVHKKIEENVSKGYAEKLSYEEAQVKHPRTWYLPVFAVANHHKPNKVRIVYDAAAKTNGVCLNDFLMKGPDLLVPLTSVLSKHREGAVAVSADIQEMFHRILVRKEDQESQRFLWRKSENHAPETHKMRVMTFGASCSPRSAQFCKNINAKRFEERYPRAVEGIMSKHYVDDYLDSFSSEQEALQVTKEIIWIHAQIGMNLRNWSSNSTLISNNLNQEKTLCSDVDLNKQNELQINKVLSMFWRIKED
jgi:hypothetical protein